MITKQLCNQQVEWYFILVEDKKSLENVIKSLNNVQYNKLTTFCKRFQKISSIYITISTFTSVRPSILPYHHVLSHFRVSLHLEFQRPSQTTAEQGEAKLRILDFKTTWSELQKVSLTSAERGKAMLRILDFKTTWLEFQKGSQTAAE